MTTQESQAYNTGYDAHDRGESRTANPYAPGTWDSDEWLRGWDDIADPVDDVPDFDTIDWGNARWRLVDEIATFISCVYGPHGDEPDEVEVVLQSAEVDGVTAYRWCECDQAGEHSHGEPTPDKDEAIADGEEYAAANDDTPDVDDLIRQIAESGCFGDADHDDIRAVCKEATKHSQGYLLLPVGEFVGHPIGRMWTTNGYLQCDHVALPATFSRISLAADALLRAVTVDE